MRVDRAGSGKMKNILANPIVPVFLLILTSCDKDCTESSGIRGEWEWEKSTGGLGGWTITPETIMATRTLRIDDLVFREYQNDSLVFESPYDLYTTPDTVWGTNLYITFESGGTEAVILDESNLQLIELCADCFEHHYQRK